MKKILFCHVGWMKKYNGIKGDSAERGGSYNQTKVGCEIYNFRSVRGYVYGFVRTVKERGQIKIERIGAGKNDESVSGITVVWTATKKSGGRFVVGWYKNATVYRELQESPERTKLQDDNEFEFYRIKALADDATLLPPEKRAFLIPSGADFFGQNNVWYAESDEANSLVNEVREFINKGYIEELPGLDTSLSGKEGNTRFVTHLKRERNPALVKTKKEKILKKTGKLCCEVCDFDFKETYGEIGEGFCEVHHLKQLSKADGEVETRLQDLAIVCSNCHRIIHKQEPMLTMKKLKQVINALKK